MLPAQVSERAAVRAGLTHEESGTASTPDTAVAEVLLLPPPICCQRLQVG